jgi:hypothetical protein
MRSLPRGANAGPDGKEDEMNAIRVHFAAHRSHMAVCALAGVLFITGIAVGTPVLVVLGALMCGAMMLGMVWMMVSMARHR